MSERSYAIDEKIEQRYQVIAPLGAGGMGTLYRVADVGRDGQEVALKMLKLNLPGISAAEMLRGFQREFQLLTQLQHPNLVEVYNYGVTVEEDFYYTMEYIEGVDLAKGMQEMSLEFLLPIMVQICRALGYLHAREIMHGDLKPANVLLCGEQVKIVDFGLAHDLRFEKDQPHYITPFYAAPEVSKGKRADGRADLYSLGAMIYTWILGEAPAFMVGAERLIRMTLRERLASQAVIAPGIDSVVLRLLAQDPAQRYTNANQVITAINSAMGSAYTLETRETAGSYALRAGFLGRDGELAQLRDIWEGACKSNGQLVLIGGESGVGKTRLLEELEVGVALEGARVVRGQSIESGGAAYQPWREVLRVLLRYVEIKESLELKRVGPVLAAIIPELWSRPTMAGLSPPAELEPQAAQQRLNDAILQVLQAAAEMRPTLVVIDDAHWADEASLEMLRYLGRVLGKVGLLVCVTYRSDEVTTEHALVELRDEQVEQFILEPLPAEDTQELVRSMLGLGELPTELIERVQSTTGGNTFFVQELIRSLAEEGQVLQRTVAGWQVDQAALQTAQLPGSIQQVVWRRLEQLSEGAQQVLRWASVVGVIFWEGAIAALENTDADAERARVRAALGECLEREIVIERPESTIPGEREYLFVKPAMQEVSYESLAQDQRKESHARVADWLIGRPDEQVDEHLGLIAEQLLGAGRTPQGVNYLRRAGEQAMAQFAAAQAIGYFSRALELTPIEDHTGRYTLLLARERIYDLQGVRGAQDQDLSDLMGLADALADERRQAEVYLRRGDYAEGVSDYLGAISAIEAAIRLSQSAQDVDNLAEGYMHLGKTLWRHGEYPEARRKLEQALTLAQSAGLPQIEAISLLNLGNVADFLGDAARAIRYYERSLPIFLEIGNSRDGGGSLNNLGLVCLQQGDYTRARDYLEQAVHIFREVGDRRGEYLVLSNLGKLYDHLGVGQTAVECNQQALRIAEEIGDRAGQGYTCTNLSQICHHRGDHQAARQYSLRALRIAQDVANPSLQGIVLTHLGHALVGLGQLAQATEAYQQAVTLRRDSGQHFLVIESQAGLGRVSLAQGDLQSALAEVEEILRYLELEDSTLYGTGEPLKIFLTCYQVLEANQDPRAEAILRSAYDLLDDRAAKISDEGLRRSFLENVVTHREIICEYNQKLSSEN